VAGFDRTKDLVADVTATLVLDEADRLLDQGFRNELMKIIGTLPKREVVDRQTLLFTATVPDGIRKVRLSSSRYLAEQY
jgi:superfamily II DNA/RNA helicase